MVTALAWKQVDRTTEDSLERYTRRSPTAPRPGLPHVTSRDAWRDAACPILPPWAQERSKCRPTETHKGCVCACASCSVPCHHPALRVTPGLMECPWPGWGGPLARNRTWAVLAGPRLTQTRLNLMNKAGRLSEECRRSALRCCQLQPCTPAEDFGNQTSIQLRKHGWYLCHVCIDTVKYPMSNFEEKCNFSL